jgi:hypothetical protein
MTLLRRIALRPAQAVETAAPWKPWKNELHVFPPFPPRLENSAKQPPSFPQFPQLLVRDLFQKGTDKTPSYARALIGKPDMSCATKSGHFNLLRTGGQGIEKG